MNKPYASPKARLGEPAGKKFSLRHAFLAYLSAITTFATLVVALGLVVSGKLPTASGYLILWPFTLTSSLLVAAIGGRLTKKSMFMAAGVGVIGGLSLLLITSAAAFTYGIYLRAA